MTDHSIKENLKGTNRHRIGTPHDLLRSHRDGNGMGKILNALEFPMSYPPPENAPLQGLASDVEAFQNTAGMRCCSVNEAFPFSSMRWGLGATADAYHTFHLDCDGFATYLNVKTGAKWWIVATPKEGVSLANTTLFTSNYRIDKMNMGQFNYESILLSPDMEL
jgi:hypothetical protein